jgi:hypothetical protein
LLVPVVVEKEGQPIRKKETPSAGVAASNRPAARETRPLLAGFLVVSMVALPPVSPRRRSTDQIVAELGR